MQQRRPGNNRQPVQEMSRQESRPTTELAERPPAQPERRRPPRKRPEKPEKHELQFRPRDVLARAAVFVIFLLVMLNLFPLKDATPLNGFCRTGDEEVKLATQSGWNAEVPGNVLESFVEAKDSRIMVFSVSVYMTSDRVLVVSDTGDLSEVTEMESGQISQTPYEELKALNFAYRFAGSDGDYPYRAEPLHCVTLEELFVNFPYSDFIVEIREDERSSEAAVILIELIRSNGLSSRVVVRGNSDAMTAVRENTNVTVITGASVSELKSYDRYSRMFLAYLYGGVDFQYMEIPVGELSGYSKRTISSLRGRNVSLFVAGVRTEAQLRLALEYGCDGVIAQDPVSIVNMLERIREEERNSK